MKLLCRRSITFPIIFKWYRWYNKNCNGQKGGTFKLSHLTESSCGKILETVAASAAASWGNCSIHHSAEFRFFIFCALLYLFYFHECFYPACFVKQASNNRCVGNKSQRYWSLHVNEQEPTRFNYDNFFWNSFLPFMKLSVIMPCGCGAESVCKA